MWECVCVWVRRNRTHTFEQLENLLLFYFFFFCVVESILEFLEFSCCCCFFCRSFYDDEVGGRLKVRSRARCGCSLRAWLKVVIASASPVHFVSLFSSFLLLLTHFTFSGFFQSPPFPILFFLPGPFLLVVSHHSDRYSMCLPLSNRTVPTHTKAETREKKRSTMQLDNSFVWFRIFFFSFFLPFVISICFPPDGSCVKKQQIPCLLYPNVSFVFDSLTPTASESAGLDEPESVQVFKVFFLCLFDPAQTHTLALRVCNYAKVYWIWESQK